jgi:hypothetical protein
MAKNSEFSDFKSFGGGGLYSLNQMPISTALYAHITFNIFHMALYQCHFYCKTGNDLAPLATLK